MKNKLSEKMKFYRKLNGLTQKQVADKIGVSNQFINQIETGKCNPSYYTLVKIKEKLNFDPL